MFCKNCGANAPDGANNCPACGAFIGDSYFSGAMDLGGSASVSSGASKAEPVNGYEQNVKINMGGHNIQAEAHTQPQPGAEKRFCTYCGATMTPGSRFCTSCGKENGSGVSDVLKGVKDTVGGGISKVSGAVNEVVKKKSKKELFIILGAAAALLTVLIIIIVCSSIRSAEEAVEQFVEARYDGELDELLELIPEEAMTYLMKEEKFDPGEYNEFYEDSEQNIKDGLNDITDGFGKDWDYDYEILYFEEVTGEKLLEIQELYQRKCGIRVTEMQTAKVEIVISGKEEEQSSKKELDLIKIGSSWYIDVETMDDVI